MVKNFCFKLLVGLVIFMLTLSQVNAGQPNTHIPLLKATVKGLLFYESGEGFPPKKDRVYRTVFNQSQTGFINWELNIIYPKPGKRIEFPIHYKYYDPQGNMLTEYDINSSYIEANWTIAYST